MDQYNIKIGKAYQTVEGFIVQREKGLTPNGNHLMEVWVVRSQDGYFLHFSEYLNDIIEKYGKLLDEKGRL